MGAIRFGARLGGALLVSAAVASGVLSVPQAQAESDPLTMVALGDSQAAGPLVTTQNSWDCLRSNDNWPAVAARSIGASLTDVTCSGATSADLTGKRFGYMAPQLDAVKADTDIVTMTIGANDLSLGTTVPGCMNPFPQPFGLACTSWMQDNTNAQLATLRPRIAAALQAIHHKARAARVYVVSYFHYWSKTGCYPVDPIWSVDATWLQSIFDRLNATLKTTAEANGAAYVDLATPSKGHGVCANPLDGSKWVEGFVPTSQAAPYHPNAAGNAAAGALVAAAIG